MRVVNDHKERREQEGVGPLGLISHSLFSAIGISTLFLGPLSMLYGAGKLVAPWPQATALLGSIIALTFLDVPLVYVLVSFVTGMLVVDAVLNSRPLSVLLAMVLLVGSVLGLGIAGGGASLHGVGLSEFWGSSVADTLNGWREQAGLNSLAIGQVIDWDQIETLLVFEGPFLYLSFLLFSVWIGLGIAAHFNWWAEGHAYSAESLRGFRLPKLVVPFYLGLVVATFFVSSNYSFLLSGFTRLVSVWVFIQGSVVLSGILKRRGVSQPTKIFVYVLVVTVGFYFVIGLGIIQSWIESLTPNRSKQFKSEPLDLTRAEEVI